MLLAVTAAEMITTYTCLFTMSNTGQAYRGCLSWSIRAWRWVVLDRNSRFSFSFEFIPLYPAPDCSTIFLPSTRLQRAQ